MEADDSHQPLLRKGVTTKNTSPRIVSWSICFASLLLFALLQTDRFGVTTSALATLGSTAAKSLFSSHALGKTAAPVENADAPIAGQIATLNTQNSTYRERAETCEAAAREERERYLRIGPSCSGNDVISANRTHLVIN